jgi:lactoylglutathione lyase
VPIEPGGWSVFSWRERDDPDRVGSTVWSLFKKDTTYFGPGEPAFMGQGPQGHRIELWEPAPGH